MVSAILAYEYSVPYRIGYSEALSRLDVGWGLHHRLVSAWEGVGEWPENPGKGSVTRLRPLVFLGPVLLGGLLFLFAMGVPLPPTSEIPNSARVEPPDWKTLKRLAEQLEQKEFVEPEAIQALRRDLEQLREKPMEEWYAPSSLEATDRLRSRMRNDAERLQHAMQNTSALLQLADQERDNLSTPQQQAMQEFLQEMRNQMADGGLKLNQEMLQKLEQVDLSQLQQIDPEALKQLEQQLMENGQALENALVQAGLIAGIGEDPGSGGGIDGGGPSALTLNDFEPIAEPVVPMALDPGDLEDARMGDLLELRETEHDQEREMSPVSAGEIRTEGGAGEVAWDQDVLPDEEKILKEFFK